MQKKLLILGSTGSVGEQAIDVAVRSGYPVLGLVANRNDKRAEEQARLLHPKAVAMADAGAAGRLRTALADTDIRVFGGENGVLEIIRETDADFAVNAILGKAGLLPTLAALESGKDLALANKESLVIAGAPVLACAKAHGRRITPVDSEHSAIFQTLRAGGHKEIKKLILTASGGPFFGKTRAELENVTVRDTLAHPTWRMGAKITVDSATMMNKGFEVIEAAHLFSVPAEKIDVVIHRESMIHSMVEYIDNSIIAQLSMPDMRLCVQYALTAPERCDAVIPELDLISAGKMTFAAPDRETFPLLDLAGEMFSAGGGMPAVLNAADEIAVDAFLKEKIGFLRISELVAEVCAQCAFAKSAGTPEELLEVDRIARERTISMIRKEKL